MQRGRLKEKACRNNKLVHGAYGIQALEPVWLTLVKLKLQDSYYSRDKTTRKIMD